MGRLLTYAEDGKTEETLRLLDPVQLRQLTVPPAAQQPVWSNPWLAEEVRQQLTARPGLVGSHEVAGLRSLLAEVAAGHMRILQAGDCAEDPADCTAAGVRARVGLLDSLSEAMRSAADRPVLRIGRIAGQLAKPRSQPVELVGGREIPVYRGHLVNGPAATPADRTADLRRLPAGYELSSAVMRHLRACGRDARSGAADAVWTSHEALVLDYELPLLRRTESGELLLTSTHLPWIGERTRQADGAHVRLLSSVVNPVACKVGPAMTTDELLALCTALDPDRTPGRLVLISRLGADRAHRTLPPLVRAVRDAGHPVVWLCDPMHGNTFRDTLGHKTRAVTDIVRELESFQDAVLAERGTPGGVHLEATPHAVDECVLDHAGASGPVRTSFCDPRLNPGQAREVVSTWRA